MSNGAQPIVLLIEPDAALRRLIALGLYHRGMRVMTAASLAAISTRALRRPDIVLLDVDNGIESDWSLIDETRAHPLLGALPILVLAWDAPIMVPVLADDDDHLTLIARVTYAAKPFDARALYETIDELLAASGLQPVASIQTANAQVAPRPTMSIWPLITAAGLFIAIAGFLVQIVVAIAGLLIVLIALLWWTLEATNSAPASLPSTT